MRSKVQKDTSSSPRAVRTLLVESDKRPLHTSLCNLLGGSWPRALGEPEINEGASRQSLFVLPTKYFIQTYFKHTSRSQSYLSGPPAPTLSHGAWAAAALPSKCPPPRPSPSLHPAARLISRNTRHCGSPRAQPRDGSPPPAEQENVTAWDPKLAGWLPVPTSGFDPRLTSAPFTLENALFPPYPAHSHASFLRPQSEGVSSRGVPGPLAAAIAGSHGTPVSQLPGLLPGC